MDKSLKQKLIHDGPNTKIFYSKEHSLAIVELKDVKVIDELSYKKNALAFLDFVREKEIKKMIFNAINFQSFFTTHLQKWIAEKINKHLIILMKKIAIIEAREPLSHISLQLYVEEAQKYRARARVKYFATQDEALKWILKE